MADVSPIGCAGMNLVESQLTGGIAHVQCWITSFAIFCEIMGDVCSIPQETYACEFIFVAEICPV